MVQRFYPAVEVLGQCRPDWKIAVQLGERLGLNLPRSTGALFAQISESVPDYAGLGYRDLARSPQQWPPVGGRDLFFGGTAYKNAQGLGVRLAPAVEREPGLKLQWTEPPSKAEGEGFLLVPVEQLYDGGTTLMPSKLLDPRRAKAKLILSPQDAAKLGAGEGLRAEVRWNGKAYTLPIEAREGVPAGAGLVPRSLGLPVHAPLFAEIWPVK
jgi:predicted molibdopterin-dependent oxidoreductase YjgC